MPDPFADLMLEAARCLSRLSQSLSLRGPNDALEAVRGFIEAEARVLASQGARVRLEHEVTVPLDPTGQRLNHAMLAGMMLARSGWPGSAAALLAAARSRDTWCATQARLNLCWLAPSPVNRDRLIEELATARASPGTMPVPLLIESLIYQRDAAAAQPVVKYILAPGDAEERSQALTLLVHLQPDLGLGLLPDVEALGEPVLSAAALGLAAVYGDLDAYRRLCDLLKAERSPPAAASHWIGQVPLLSSVELLARSLAHPDAAVRLEAVSALSCLEERTAWEHVLTAFDDRDPGVAAQAINLVLLWRADDPQLSKLGGSFDHDARGNLRAEGRRALAALARSALASQQPGVRFRNGQPLSVAQMLDDLYGTTFPELRWHHWVATTGAPAPYSVRKTALYNHPTLEQLEDWHQANQDSFRPGGFYYRGAPVSLPPG